jgi:hypothetical protein
MVLNMREELVNNKSLRTWERGGLSSQGDTLACDPAFLVGMGDTILSWAAVALRVSAFKSLFSEVT